MGGDDSVVHEETQLAVDGQGIHFYFGTIKKNSPVLNGFNVAVRRGTIYSLLGPSGCGKTTLLKCVIGHYTIRKGSLKIFGRSPGSKGFFIPGRGVGYMPQELALYLDMTTEETLAYFGSLYQMDKEEIKERINFLVDLLELPDKKRQIKYLSGGQQRRVSFAIALVHKPPLLVLDEPTVGVDPILRQTIWKHLINMTKNEGMTVIITTHYIEEARHAHVVGLMRSGRLLIQRNPEELIKQHGVITLEDVFLRLCQRIQDEDLGKSSDALTSVDSPKYSEEKSTGVWLTKDANKQYVNGVKVSCLFEADENKCNVTFDESKDGQDHTTALLSAVSFPEEFGYSDPTFCESWMRFVCVTQKNLLCFKRNVFMMLFQVFIPAIQMMIICLCIGNDPFHLPVAVTNMETDPTGFSKTFLHSINNWTIHQIEFANISLAVESVKNAESWAAMYIGPEFSTCLVDRFLEGIELTNDTVECSNIRVYLDMSNQQIAATIYFTLLKSLQEFGSDLLVKLGKNPLMATLPLKVEDPVYGEVTTSFTEFIAPGLIVAITYLMSIGLTGISTILEKKQGLLDRTFVAGVRATELLLSLFTAFLVTLVIQLTFLLASTFLLFNIKCNGPFFWVAVCVLLAGVHGMCYGLLISVFCDTESVALLIAMGSFYPNVVISGMIWPVDAMPFYIRYFNNYLPLTLLSRSMRCILTRGWNITDHQIWDGCLVCSAWTILFLVLSMIVFKFRK